MYSNHIVACNEFSQACSVNFKRAALFVLATVQQQLETVPVALTDIVENGIGSRFAWGFKSTGVEYLESNFVELYRDAINCKQSANQLLDVFLRVPGLGLVKSGFLCQIFAGTVGCIDTHNIKLYEIPLSALRYNYGSGDTFRKQKRDRYISLCHGLGGSHFLWSHWCDYVAKLRPYNWSDGAEVSQFHFDVISGKETGAIIDLFSSVEFEPTFKQTAA